MAAVIPVRPKRVQAAPDQRAVKAVEAPSPPPHLSAESRKWWGEIAGEWVLGLDSLPVLQAGLEQWDIYQGHRKAVARQPIFKTKSGNVRANPRSKMANDALREFRMCFRQLGLEPPK